MMGPSYCVARCTAQIASPIHGGLYHVPHAYPKAQQTGFWSVGWESAVIAAHAQSTWHMRF